jgi:phosphopantetheinyl transferase
LLEIEQRATRHLGVPMFAAHVNEAIKLHRLNGLERDRLAGIRFDQRRKDWLFGRNALKELLTALGRNDNTESVSFPDSQLSLTHAGDLACAVGTPATCDGLGVDYEPVRQVNPRIARWFLNAREAQWLHQLPEGDRCAQLIRLWTIKEAAFKSCPGNGRLTLQDLSIANPDMPVSQIAVKRREIGIKVSCSRWRSGYLSIATNGGPS